MRDHQRVLDTLLFLIAIGHTVGIHAEAPCIVPDEKHQKMLSELYESPSIENYEWGKADFLENPTVSKVVLLQQAFAFLASGIEERRYYFFMYILRSLKPTRVEMLESVLPCLERQDKYIDQGIREFAISFISSGTDTPWRLEDQERAGSVIQYPDFSAVRDYFREKGQKPPTKLVKLLYYKWPGDALELMLDLNVTDEPTKDHIRLKRDLIGKREVEMILDQATKKVVPAPGVMDALNECVQSPYWWVRLYAVEVARKTPNLDVAPIIQRLKNDPEEIVRGAVQVLEKGQRGW